MCKKKECELDDKCRYFHTNNQNPGAEFTKKDIQCKFLRNCREGKNCEYYHPPTTKKNLHNNKIDPKTKKRKCTPMYIS